MPATLHAPPAAQPGTLTLQSAAGPMRWEHAEHSGLRGLTRRDLGSYASTWSAFCDHTHGHQPTRRGQWVGQENMTDQGGRRWSRSFTAVIDDFGHLVEVAR